MKTPHPLRFCCLIAAVVAIAALSPLKATVPPAIAGAYDERVIAVIETRPCDIAEGIVKINTAKELGFLLIVR